MHGPEGTTEVPVGMMVGSLHPDLNWIKVRLCLGFWNNQNQCVPSGFSANQFGRFVLFHTLRA